MWKTGSRKSIKHLSRSTDLRLQQAGTDNECEENVLKWKFRREMVIEIPTPFRKNWQGSDGVETWEKYDVRVEQDDTGQLCWRKKGSVKNVCEEAVNETDASRRPIVKTTYVYYM